MNAIKRGCRILLKTIFLTNKTACFVLILTLTNLGFVKAQTISKKIDSFLVSYQQGLNENKFELLKPYLSNKLSIPPFPDKVSLQLIKVRMNDSSHTNVKIDSLKIIKDSPDNENTRFVLWHKLKTGKEVEVKITFAIENDSLKVVELSTNFFSLLPSTSSGMTEINAEGKIVVVTDSAKIKESLKAFEKVSSGRWATDRAFKVDSHGDTTFFINKKTPSYTLKDADTLNRISENGLLQGEWERLHPDGSFKCKGIYKDGKKEGYWERKYENGNWQYQVNMKDGYQNGYCKHFYENGNIKIEGGYVMGKRDGSIKTYFENGKIQSDEFFENDILSGNSKYYDKSGQLLREGVYNENEMEGIWRYFNSKGALQAKVTYRKGKAIKTESTNH